MNLATRGSLLPTGIAPQWKNLSSSALPRTKINCNGWAAGYIANTWAQNSFTASQVGKRMGSNKCMSHANNCLLNTSHIVWYRNLELQYAPATLGLHQSSSRPEAPVAHRLGAVGSWQASQDIKPETRLWCPHVVIFVPIKVLFPSHCKYWLHIYLTESGQETTSIPNKLVRAPGGASPCFLPSIQSIFSSFLSQRATDPKANEKGWPYSALKVPMSLSPAPENCEAKQTLNRSHILQCDQQRT